MVWVCFCLNIFTQHVSLVCHFPSVQHAIRHFHIFPGAPSTLANGVGRKSRPVSRGLDVPIHTYKESNYISQLYTSQQDFQGQVFDLCDHALMTGKRLFWL